MTSLERKIVLWLAVVLVITFSVLLIISIQVVKNISDAYVITRLEHDSEALLSSLKLNPRGLKRLREGRITPIYQQPLSGHYFYFSFSDGTQIRSRSLWDESLKTRDRKVGEVVTYREDGPDQQSLLIRSAGYEKLGQRFTLTVAEDMQPLEADLLYFQKLALILLPVIALFIILIQRYVLRRGFQSLDQVRSEVASVTSGQTQLIQKLGPDEIRPLSLEINRLLKQVQQRLKRSRESLGNLAHGLKGPLSLMTHDIDHLKIDTVQKKALSSRLARITTLIERELKRARSSGEHAGKHFNPVLDLPDLIDALKQLYKNRSLQFNFEEFPNTALPLDHEDMLELLGNLLDNACKWANQKIALQLSITDHLLIKIEDDGPGVPDAQYSMMSQRGTRLDELEDGYGLGLAIVNDLVNSYHGELIFSRSAELKGLSVSVTLPIVGGDD